MLDHARKQLVIIQVRVANEEAAAKRKQLALATQAKEKAEGKTSFYEGQESNTAESWGRGSAI